MIHFQKLMSEVAQPNSEDEMNFKAKHIIDVKDYPEGTKPFSTDGKKARRIADYKSDEDEKKVYEANTQTISKDFKGIRRTDNLAVGDRVHVATGHPEPKKATVKEVHPHGVTVRIDGSAMPGFWPHTKITKLSEGNINLGAKDAFGREDDDINNDDMVNKIDKHMRLGRKMEIKKKIIDEQTDDEKLDRYLEKRRQAIARKLRSESYIYEEVSYLNLDEGTIVMSNKLAKHFGDTKFTKAEYHGLDGAGNHVYSGTHPHGQHSVLVLNPNKTHMIAKDFDHKHGDHRAKALHAVMSKKRSYGKSRSHLDNYTLSHESPKVKSMVAESENLQETFKIGSMNLEDGSSVTLSRDSADLLNKLFDQLDGKNKSKMQEKLKADKKGFNEILAFAKEAV